MAALVPVLLIGLVMSVAVAPAIGQTAPLVETGGDLESPRLHASPPTGADHAGDAADVRPILERVFDNDDGTRTAVFGYKNETGAALTIPVGGHNRFFPAPRERGQPTTLQPGRVHNAVQVVFDGRFLVWRLGERVAFACARRSPPPPPPTCDYLFFGPREYVRTSGAKDVYTDAVTVPAWVAAPYLLTVRNGDENGQHRVSSARIEVNGVPVLGPSDFNQGVAILERVVSLSPASTLKVTLASQPGSFLVVELCGATKDQTAPAVTIAEPADGVAINRPTPHFVVRYDDPGPGPSSGLQLETLRVLLDGTDRTDLFSVGPAEAVADLPGALALVDGVHVLNATIQDLVGNEGSASGTFLVDTLAPSVQATATPAPNAAGWSRSDVTVSFACTDTGSGVVECPAPQVVTNETSGQVVTGSARDRAGNVSQASVTVKLDRTPPMITASMTPSPADGWNRTAVTVTFDCSDALSEVATCSPPVTLTTEGTHSITGVATDHAGNSASTELTIRIDTTPPTLTASVSPPANPDGWHRGDVTVSFACADAASGVAECPETVVIVTEGAGQVVTRTAVDRAGNTASTSVTVSLDRAGPMVTPSLAPIPNAGGWNNADVTVAFECSDPVSGVASCPAGALVSAEGSAQTVSGTASDLAGNTTTASATVSLDKTPPAINASLAPPPGPNGWNGGDVTVTFECADALSGIGNCTPPVTVTTEGAGQSVSGTASDQADNTATATATVSVDRTAPSIEVSLAPEPNANGWHRSDVSVTFTCVDALAGIAECTPPQTVTVEGAAQDIAGHGRDLAGNVAQASATVNLDRTPPTVDGSVSPPPNAAGWSKTDVSVSFDCADALSGVEQCSAPQRVTAEGANQAATGSASDKAGNSSEHSVSVNVDKTAPKLAITAPAEGAVLRTSPAEITGAVSDALSGLAGVSCGGVSASTAGASFMCSVVLTQGANQVSVTATDTAGNATTVVRNVTYNPNNSPTAHAGGPYRGDVGQPIAFDGSQSSDPDGDPLTYQWTFGDGGTAVGRNASHIYNAVGTFTVALRVDDGRGGSDTKSAPVTVRPLNQRPTARVTAPSEGEVSVELSFDGSASSDPDGDPLTYAWTFGDGGSASGVQATHTYGAPGTFAVTLTVDDGRHGGVHSASTQVRIRPRNQQPVAHIGGPYSGHVNEAVAFDASASSDPDGDLLTFRWTFGDGGSATGARPTHIYRDASTYTARLTVEDGRGGSDSKTAEVSVSVPPNRPPVARPGGPYSGEVGQVIAFDGTASSDPDGDALTYSWDFGDGTNGSGPTPSHAYGSAQSYNVTLTVTDTEQHADSATTAATVTPVADRSPPVVTLLGPHEALPGTSVTVTAEATDNVAVQSVTVEVTGEIPTVITTPPYKRVISVPSIASPGAEIRVKATARDPSGNTGFAELTIAIVTNPDSENPVVTLNSPPEATPGAPLYLTAEATDNVQVASVTFLVGGRLISVDSDPPYEVTTVVPADAAVGSSVHVTAQAVDAAGNQGEASGVIAVVSVPDDLPPTVQLSVPSRVAPGQRFVASASATDNRGIASVAFFVDGAQVATITHTPYQAEIVAPASVAAGFRLHVEARARDFSALEGSDAADVPVDDPAASQGIVKGEVYDDLSGLPLEGASVALTGTDALGAAYTQTTATESRGRYLLRARQGQGLLRVTKAGHTAVDRPIVIEAARAREAIDARLTPVRVAPQSVSLLGGEVTNGDTTLTVPAGALSATVDLTVVPVGSQALQGTLPGGWTPVAAVDVLPHGVTFDVPASLVTPVPPGLLIAPGTALWTVRWDEATGAWRAVESVESLEGHVSLEHVSTSGQYAWLLPNEQPVAPPPAVPGELLAGVGSQPIPDDAVAVIRPNPKVLFYQPGVRSDVTGSVNTTVPLPSGTRVLSRITEAYRFTNGAKIHPEPFVEDIFLYQQPAEQATLSGGYPVTPSLTFDPLALDNGTITVELLTADGAQPGTLIGAQGGTVSTATGESLELPANAVSEAIPVTVDGLLLAEAGVALPAGLGFVGGASVSFSGFELARSAVLSVPRPPSLGEASQVLLARLDDLQGETRLLLVGWGRILNDRVVSQNVLPINGTSMQGVRVEGRYLFVTPAEPVGFAAGQVLGVDGQPFAGALVSSNRLALVSLSDAAGNYVAATAIGASRLSAVDLARFDEGTAQVALSNPGDETALDLRLNPQPPRVVSVVPSEGAQNVPLSNPVLVTFSEPIDSATVSGANSGNARLDAADGTPVAAAVSLSSNNTMLTLRPTAPLSADTAYVLTLSQGIKDRSGYALPAAFVVHFTSLDTTAPPPPPAGSIRATVPDANGNTTITASQGTASPHDSVFILNVTLGTSTPVIVDPNGGFTAIVAARIGDKLQIKIVDSAGNETIVAVPRFSQTNPDGSVSTVVDAEGGRVEGPAGIAVEIPANVFAEASLVTLNSMDAPSFPFTLSVAQQRLFEFHAGVSLNFTTGSADAALALSVPADPSGADGDRWMVGELLQFGDDKLLNTVAAARRGSGRVTTLLEACPGVRRAGTYGFFKAKRSLGLVSGQAASAEPTIMRVVDPAPDEMPFVAFASTAVNPAGQFCIPIVTGPDPGTATTFTLSATPYTSPPAGGPTVTSTAAAGSVAMPYATITGQVGPGQSASVGAYPPDTTPPALEAVLPPLDVPVPPGISLRLAFSEPIDLASLRAGVVLVRALPNGTFASLPTALRVSRMDTFATVIPGTALAFDADYVLRLTNLKDRAGNAMSDAELSFRTFSPVRAAWLPTEPLKDFALRVGPQNRTLLIAATDGARNTPQLLTIDVSDLRQPRQVSSTDSPTAHQRRMAVIDSARLPQSSTPVDLAITSSLYWNPETVGFPIRHTRINFYDITDPAAPRFVGAKRLTTHPDEPESPAVIGTLHDDSTAEAYPRGVAFMQEANGYRAYMAISKVGILSVDVGGNIPEVPDEQRVLDDRMWRGDYIDVDVMDNWILAANASARRLDVLPRPNAIGGGSSPDLGCTPRRVIHSKGHWIDRNGDGIAVPAERVPLAFIGCDTGVQVIDLSDPGHPRPVGAVAAGNVRELALDAANRRLLTVGRVSGLSEGLALIDVSDPRGALQDADGDGKDDRIVWQASTQGSVSSARFNAGGTALYLVGSSGVETYDLGGAAVKLVWLGREDSESIVIRQGGDTGYGAALVRAVTPSAGSCAWRVSDPAVLGVTPFGATNSDARIKGLVGGTSILEVRCTDTNGTTAASVPVTVIYPIVLVHGFLSSSSTWDTLSRSFMEAGLMRGADNLCDVPLQGGPSSNIDFCAMDFSRTQVAHGTFVEQASALRDAVARLRAATGADKVTLIGHSMGGLVSRAYIQLLSGSDVSLLMTLGTPHYGTPLIPIVKTAEPSGVLLSAFLWKLLGHFGIDLRSEQAVAMDPVSAELRLLNIQRVNELGRGGARYVSVRYKMPSSAADVAAWIWHSLFCADNNPAACLAGCAIRRDVLCAAACARIPLFSTGNAFLCNLSPWAGGFFEDSDLAVRVRDQSLNRVWPGGTDEFVPDVIHILETESDVTGALVRKHLRIE